MRTYHETTKNRRQLDAIPSDDEVALYLALQAAIRDAAFKVFDKHTELVTALNFNPVFALDGQRYTPDLFEAHLRQDEGDGWRPSLSIRMSLRIPNTDNPDFDAEREVEY